jgi:hypothetical protein
MEADDKFPQRSLIPKLTSKIIVNALKTIIHTHSFAAPWWARGRQWQRSEVIDVGIAQSRGPKSRNGIYLIWHDFLQGQVQGGNQRLHGWPWPLRNKLRGTTGSVSFVRLVLGAAFPTFDWR